MTNSGKWLKKYMQHKHKYLENTLKRNELFLGDPDDWSDKNDSTLIDLYKCKKGFKEIRATCLTSAPDRYHFWEIFGGKKEGVCLWFDKKEFIKGIKNDKTLLYKKIKYRKPKDLTQEGTVEDLPFYKRKQYKDESEFRVLRCINKDETRPPTRLEYFSFAPKSLRRIYINSWLDKGEYESWKKEINTCLSGDLAHVKIFRSRVTEYREWTNAAQVICTNANKKTPPVS